MRGKPKYSVKWKEYTAEKDTWEGLENLGNAMDLVKELGKEIREKEIRRVYRRKERRRNYWIQKQRYLKGVNDQRSILQKYCLGRTMESLKISIWRSWGGVGQDEKRKKGKFF